MQEEMGYRNAKAVYPIIRQGRLLKTREDGKRSTNSLAIAILQYMAISTYDWPPTDEMKAKYVPCRYYQLGWRSIAEDLGMLAVGIDAEDFEAAMKSREITARNRVSQAWKFLTEQGVIKCLVPASLGRNAGYLLLIGDGPENREVEAWARRCLGLPQH